MPTTITRENIQTYIDKGLIDPSKIKIDLNKTKTAGDNTHRWVTLLSAIDSGYDFNFDYDVPEIKTPKTTTLPEVEVTSAKNSTDNLQNQDIPTRSGIDIYAGANYSPRFDSASSELGMNPLNWTKYIPGSYWDSDTHKAVESGSKDAAIMISAPLIAYGAAEYALPWLAENMAPYLTARGWLGATQAAGNTPTWLTPTSATAIDATLAGSTTGAAINDIVQNGPTVENVLGTGLGIVGLGIEAAPTIMEGAQAIKPITALKNQDNRQALYDLFRYITNGLYRNKFSINPETNQVLWSKTIPKGNVSFVEQATKLGHPKNGRIGNFYISTKNGTLTFNPELKTTAYSSRMPEEWGGWGETYIGGLPNGKTNRFVLTPPRVDQGGTNLNLPNTLPKSIMKDFWINGRASARPGTYLSGDETYYPIGLEAIEIYQQQGLIPAIKRTLQPRSWQTMVKSGLSPDSYVSIIRLAQRDGSDLRWGYGFTNWNNTAVENRNIYEAFKLYKNGTISPLEYEKIFNDWIIPLGGRPLEWQTYGGKLIPLHPHPFIYIRKQGGKINK